MTLYIGGDGRKIESVFIGTYSGYTEIREAYLNGSMVFKKRYPFDEVIYNTAGIHDFVVPDGNSFVDVEVYGARGQSLSNAGGNGGTVTCRISVTGGQHLYCYVGFVPNGGRVAQYNASDIRTTWDSVTGDSLNSRLIVAGGGGNSGVVGGGGYWAGAGAGGAGGYPNGVGGGTVNPKVGYAAYGGGGATQSGFGGGGGVAGHNWGAGGGGANGNFGLGGYGGPQSSRGGYGGAGGAGWYGGGGGGTAIHNDSEGDKWYMDGGGGGGSSYANPAYCSNIVYTGGNNNGNGWIKIKQVAI